MEWLTYLCTTGEKAQSEHGCTRSEFCRRSGLHPDFNGDWLIVSIFKVRAA